MYLNLYFISKARIRQSRIPVALPAKYSVFSRNYKYKNWPCKAVQSQRGFHYLPFPLVIQQRQRGLRTTCVTTHCDFEAEAAAAAAQRDQRRLEPLERAACLQRRQPLLARQVARRGERA